MNQSGGTPGVQKEAMKMQQTAGVLRSPLQLS